MTARCLESSHLTFLSCHYEMLLQKLFWGEGCFGLGFFLASLSATLSQKVVGGSGFNAAYLRRLEVLFKLCAAWQ